MNTHNDSWEAPFYELTKTMDGQYRPQLLKLFRTEIAAAEKQKVEEIVEKVREFYEQNKNDDYGVAQDFSEGWDAGLESLLRILSHLQAEDQKHD